MFKGVFFLYLFVTIVVIWSMESLKIDSIFKKNKLYQTRILYASFGFSIIYLVTSWLHQIFLKLQSNFLLDKSFLVSSAILACIIIWSMDALNINRFFKKNRIFQARIFYGLLGISLLSLMASLLEHLISTFYLY